MPIVNKFRALIIQEGRVDTTQDVIEGIDVYCIDSHTYLILKPSSQLNIHSQQTCMWIAHMHTILCL